MEIQLFSNHHPISLLIDLSNSHPGGSSGKANARFLQDVKDPMRVSWEASPPHMSFLAIRKAIRFYKQFCIAEAVKAKMEEAKIIKSLEFWQLLLHFDPHNKANKSTIKDHWSQLQTFMNRKEVDIGFGLEPIG